MTNENDTLRSRHAGRGKSATRGKLGALVLTMLLMLSSCSKPTEPEAQIRAVIDQAEVAAEARDLGDISALLAENYTDQRGNDKAEAEKLLRLLFVTHQSIHLLVTIESISFETPSVANVVALVGMADTAETLPDVNVYQFDVRLAKRGDQDWQLVEADWRRGLGKPPTR